MRGKATYPAVVPGSRYSRLEVIEPAVPYAPPGSRKSWRQWLCRCACGAETVARDAALKNGTTRSCGCLVKEMLVTRNTKHGHGKRGESRTYQTWCHIISRCENPNVPQFADYGGRGIKVCERWRQGEGGLTGFECFLADMGEKPGPAFSLDRYPDNDGGYEPGNCRWATRGEQARNTRQNNNLTFNGRTMCIKDWAAEYGMGAPTLRYRLAAGHSLEAALTTPPGRIDRRRN